jgi:uncharacterized protein involved in type VI secretion and phage assembly
MSYFNSSFSTERKDTGRNNKFYGKYRAIVSNNNDKKDKMGRIKVKCPAVLGTDESQWCNPCLPFAGKDKGLFFLPKVGDSVWVEFEEGDPNKPIWVGNWFGLQEMPNSSNVYSNLGKYHVLQTDETHILFNDKDKTVTIKGNVRVIIDCPATINGSVSINGNLNVNQGINGGGNINADGTVNGSNI